MWRWFRRRRDADLDEEIRAHLDMAARDRLEAGATKAEAQAGAAALRATSVDPAITLRTE